MPNTKRPLDCCRLIAPLILLVGGCVPRPENEVVVYSALDQEFAAPMLSSFDRHVDSEIKVNARFDIESTKTIGLVNRILGERDRPVCDLFWNNEIIHTVRLQKAGLLKEIDWPVDTVWPAGCIASDGTWCGFAARARVLIVNKKLLPDPDQWPTSVLDLADPKWKGQGAIARPLFGTTATHAAVLENQLGQEKADALFREIQQNAVTLSGNKQVAQAVSAGQVAWGLTDTDDAVIERDLGFPVAIVYPDQQPDQMGTLRIPNTLAVLKDAPHPVAAEQLALFLMSPETEKRLAMGNSSQIPLFRSVKEQPRVLPEESVRWLDADFEAAADRWEPLAERLNGIFVD
ncbi:extracellular solute-binding protein [Rosistilla oblonga]|uniref:Fe(3+)-binding periplasmic protein n=1 Tax=Rosistilla oblonga TaxID=2527990 RepID=A0A518IPY5_9BACT|nr:extracellular solute-binding protein [Rosistilla oblonga]QDV55144.1 Fe(3+)-binding periplasmic protein precursor [Rosistilla oblonga]